MDAASNLQWIWVIETLASSNEIDISLLIDLVKQAPELSDDTGRNAKELVSLRCLEALFVYEISDANNDPLVFADNLGFDRSIRSEDVLRHLLSKVLSDEKMAGPQASRYDVRSFITKRKSCLPKRAMQEIKDATLDSTNPLSAVLKAEGSFEPRLDKSSDLCTKASKRFKQDISPRLNVIQDFESSQRVVGLSAGIPRSMVQKENLDSSRGNCLSSYSRAFSEYQKVQKMALLARKDLTAFFGFGVGRC